MLLLKTHISTQNVEKNKIRIKVLFYILLIFPLVWWRGVLMYDLLGESIITEKSKRNTIFSMQTIVLV